jgi:hypothetical protein
MHPEAAEGGGGDELAAMQSAQLSNMCLDAQLSIKTLLTLLDHKLLAEMLQVDGLGHPPSSSTSSSSTSSARRGGGVGSAAALGASPDPPSAAKVQQIESDGVQMKSKVSMSLFLSLPLSLPPNKGL